MPLTRVGSSTKANPTMVHPIFSKVLPVISGVMMTALLWSQAGLMLPVSLGKPAVSASQKSGKYSWQNLLEALQQKFKLGRFSRSGTGSICLIVPSQSKDAKSVPLMWNPNPRFLWVGAFQDLELLDRAQNELWESSVPVTEAGKGHNQSGVKVALSSSETLPLQSVVFPGSPKLMPDGSYDVLFKSGQIGGALVSFKMVSVEMADQISRDLAQQESELKARKAKPDELLQARAEYFFQKDLYLDALQALYEASQINPQSQGDLQSLVTEVCKPGS